MSVQASDIKFYLTGAASDGGAQADPNASLGLYRSSTEISSGVLNNLFDNVASAEAAAGDTEYRCFCIKNTAAETLYNVVAWLYSETDPDGSQAFSFAIETPATANLTNGAAQAAVANESTAPTVNTTDHNGTGSGVTNWSTATTKDTAPTIAVGAHDVNLDTNEQIFIWLKRVISAAAPARSNMAITIRCEGDTN